ncbi:MAG TPA: ABC transporter ATP-binding protein [Anaerolineales bacterium]|nr:ABC transporter ATP-binding protein [Anaerolineales bacterium]
MLEVQNISTFYGHIQALRDISLEVHQGEIVSLIGANGAGKSTLLNSISGIVPPRYGKILLEEQDIAHRAADSIVALGVTQIPERRQIFGTLTIPDNLFLGAYLRLRRKEHKAVQQDMDYVYSLFPVLKQRKAQLAGTLSGGEQQMLAIGRGLMARPKLLLLDEPSLGLAPLIVEEIFRVITQLKEEGTTVLLVEQNARAALEISDRAYVLETGRISIKGTPKELIANQEVQSAYLGRRSNHSKLSTAR